MPTEQLVISVSEKGTLVVKRNLESVGASAGRAAKGVTMLKGALAALGVASAAMVTISSVKLLADFGQNMSTVRAITGATGEEFESLRETAKMLGETTRYTASQAAEAMVNLSRAGFSAKETIESVDDTLRLAQAGALDLATAARLTTQSLRGFGLETDQASRVTDVLAKAANSANTDVVQLGEGLKFVAPIAAGLGVELEETVAVLQGLADAGLQATLGGTGMRMMLNRLENPVGQAKGVLKELGLTADQVSVSTHGLTNVLSLLQDRGLSTGQALRLFGARAGSAGSIATKMAKALPEMTKALQDAEGYALRTADIMDDNLNGALLRAKSAIQAVVIEFGDLGAESALTQFMNNFAAATRWVAHNMETLAKVTQIAATMLGVVFAQRAIAAALTGLKAMGAALAKLWALIMANPFIALAALIAGAIAALYAFRNEIDVFGNNLVTLGDVGSAAIDELKIAFGLMADEGEAAFDRVEDKGESALSNIKLFGLSMLQAALQVVDKVVGSITGVFNGIYRGVSLIIDKIKGKSVSWEEIGLAFSEEVIAGVTSSNLEDAFLSVLDRAEQKALQRLSDKAKEIRQKGKETAPEPTGGGDTEAPGFAMPETSFDQIRAGLEQENALLRLNNKEREIQNWLLDIEADLKEKLTPSQEAEARALIETNFALQEQNALLDEIRGPQEDFNTRSAALKVLLDEGKISLDEYNTKLKELKDTLLQTTEDSGLSEALGGALFDNASRALDDFISGGEVGFKEFAQSVLADIARITAQLLLMKALTKLGIPGLPGFQHGGSFKVGGTGGTDSQVVAFKATPGEHVTVSRPGEAAPAAAGGPSQTNVPVTIMNQFDDGMVLDAMNTPSGGKVIMNFITRNKNTIRRTLGG